MTLTKEQQEILNLLRSGTWDNFNMAIAMLRSEQWTDWGIAVALVNTSHSVFTLDALFEVWKGQEDTYLLIAVLTYDDVGSNSTHYAVDMYFECNGVWNLYFDWKEIVE